MQPFNSNVVGAFFDIFVLTDAVDPGPGPFFANLLEYHPCTDVLVMLRYSFGTCPVVVSCLNWDFRFFFCIGGIRDRGDQAWVYGGGHPDQGGGGPSGGEAAHVTPPRAQQRREGK